MLHVLRDRRRVLDSCAGLLALLRSDLRCARVLLAVVKAEIAWLFSYIEWRTIQTALGQVQGLGAAFLPVLLVTMTMTIVVYFSVASARR